jgi:hypothetical protein
VLVGASPGAFVRAGAGLVVQGDCGLQRRSQSDNGLTNRHCSRGPSPHPAKGDIGALERGRVLAPSRRHQLRRLRPAQGRPGDRGDAGAAVIAAGAGGAGGEGKR